MAKASIGVNLQMEGFSLRPLTPAERNKVLMQRQPSRPYLDDVVRRQAEAVSACLLDHEGNNVPYRQVIDFPTSLLMTLFDTILRLTDAKEESECQQN